jgi:ubiquinone/menaquinone biosynthesis C-methylase UbiE
MLMQTFKQFEHSGWELVAGKYDEYFQGLTRQTVPALMDGVGAAAGIKLIDVACGPGYVAAEALKRGCTVTGVDFSATMVAKAASTFPEIDFIEGDAENLSMAKDSFDAYTMNFGILHLEQPERALKDAHRVLRVGGRAGLTAWSTAQEALGFACVLQAIQKHGDSSVQLPEGPPFFRFSEEAEFERCLKQAGFEQVEFCRINMEWQLNDSSDLFDAFYLGSPRTGGLLRAQPAKNLDCIKQAVNETSRDFLRNGKLRIPMEALLAIARK